MLFYSKYDLSFLEFVYKEAKAKTAVSTRDIVKEND